MQLPIYKFVQSSPVFEYKNSNRVIVICPKEIAVDDRDESISEMCPFLDVW